MSNLPCALDPEADIEASLCGRLIGGEATLAELKTLEEEYRAD